MAKSEAEVKEALAKKNKLLWIIMRSLGGLVYITSFWFPDVLVTYNKPMEDCPRKIFEHLDYNCDDLNNAHGHIMAFEGGYFGPENIQGQVKAHFTLKEGFIPTQEQFDKLYPTLNIQEGYYILDDEGNIIDYLREKNYRSIVFNPFS